MNLTDNFTNFCEYADHSHPEIALRLLYRYGVIIIAITGLFGNGFQIYNVIRNRDTLTIASFIFQINFFTSCLLIVAILIPLTLMDTEAFEFNGSQKTISFHYYLNLPPVLNLLLNSAYGNATLASLERAQNVKNPLETHFMFTKVGIVITSLMMAAILALLSIHSILLIEAVYICTNPVSRVDLFITRSQKSLKPQAFGYMFHLTIVVFEVFTPSIIMSGSLTLLMETIRTIDNRHTNGYALTTSSRVIVPIVYVFAANMILVFPSHFMRILAEVLELNGYNGFEETNFWAQKVLHLVQVLHICLTCYLYLICSNRTIQVLQKYYERIRPSIIYANDKSFFRKTKEDDDFLDRRETIW